MRSVTVLDLGAAHPPNTLPWLFLIGSLDGAVGRERFEYFYLFRLAAFAECVSRKRLALDDRMQSKCVAKRMGHCATKTEPDNHYRAALVVTKLLAGFNRFIAHQDELTVTDSSERALPGARAGRIRPRVARLMEVGSRAKVLRPVACA